MQLERLRSLNVEIGDKEAQTNAAYFEGLLAPVFVMRRANDSRAIVDRAAWLEALAEAEKKPRATRITSISLLSTASSAVGTSAINARPRPNGSSRVSRGTVPISNKKAGHRHEPVTR